MLKGRDRRQREEEKTLIAPKGTKAAATKAITSHRPRAAFGDITNAALKNAALGKKDVKKVVKAETVPKAKVITSKAKAVAPAQTKRKTRNSAETASKDESDKEITSLQEDGRCVSSQSSQGSRVGGSISETDIIMAELEISHDTDEDDDLPNNSRMSLDKSMEESMHSNEGSMQEVPEGVVDIDKDDLADVTLVALYAYDIFNYYKEREKKFSLRPYMSQQPGFTQQMRAVLIDWLVEVQENFELNHETLYLGVKIVDTYFAAIPEVAREKVQLVGAVALFLASKFDERVPPAIDDFLYICDYAYQRPEFIAMEMELFRTVGYDLGRPISYRFLRRYARCVKSHMKTLYLGRYLLEMSLMDYKFCFRSESMLAASALHIARIMRDEGSWNPTLEYYTGYKLEELEPVILELNALLTTNRFKDLKTIKDKYKHGLFHCVADIPPVDSALLFPAVISEKREQ